MASTAHPRLVIIAAGAMGSAVAKKLIRAGCTVYTNLDGRSEATRQRAKEAGMIDAPRYRSQKKIRDAAANRSGHANLETLVSVDCNTVNPETAKQIARVFADTRIKFIDAAIFGVPPSDDYDPPFHASAAAEDRNVLDDFVALSKYGLRISPLTGEGAGIGDASALKMSYAGISKGMTGVYTTMILAAHASSPATAEALLKELKTSKPWVLDQMVRIVPIMLPKAWGRWRRLGNSWVGKKVTPTEGWRGSLDGDQADVKVLNKFVEDAKRTEKRRGE